MDVLNKISVLHIVTRLDVGGISTMLLNYYSHMDRSRIQFDIVAIDTGKIHGLHDSFEKLGANVSYMPTGIYKRIVFLYKMMRKNRYDIVHSHTELPSAIYLAVAAICRIKIRIAHAHLSEKNEGMRAMMLMMLLNIVVNKRFGASQFSVKALFGTRHVEEATIIRNAVDVEKYAFRSDIREEYREKLKLGQRFTVGFVGRLTYLKNLFYVLDIFNALLKRCPDAELLIIGDGELMDELCDKVKSYDMEQQVNFLGGRNDINALMMAMDALLLPSCSEGLPLVLIEAQAASLMSITSKYRVSEECKISPYLLYEDIELPVDIWVDHLIKECTAYQRTSIIDKITQQHFNIKYEAKRLTEIYIDLVVQ